MRKGIVLGFALVLLVCSAAMALMVVSNEALARVVGVAPARIAAGVKAPTVAQSTMADSDASAALSVPVEASDATAEALPSSAIVVMPRRAHDKSEADLDAEDRYFDRLAGFENHDTHRHSVARTAGAGEGAIPLPPGGIVIARQQQAVAAAPEEVEAAPVAEVPPEQEAQPQAIPTDIFGYYGAYPAVPIVNAPPAPSGVQPFQGAPYQAQPPPAVMRGY